MGIWGLNKLPQWKNQQKSENGIVATEKGFEDAKTGEVLVAVRNLAHEEGASVISSLAFDKDSYEQGDTVNVVVTFVERVKCDAISSLVISWSGVSGDVTASAAAFSTATNVVTFSATVPSEAGTLSLAAQTIAGGIFDALDDRPASDAAISSELATSAGSFDVA